MYSTFTNTYFGAGSPSASHSIKNGLSFSFCCTATWKSCSSVGGCFIIFGGECTKIWLVHLIYAARMEKEKRNNFLFLL